jgi:Skp family chaperone for outer membrane proteins
MMRLKFSILLVAGLLMSAPCLRAQLSNVAVVDFEGAVVQSAEGKKASDKFNTAAQAKQTEIEKRQKELEDQQKKLVNGARTLSDSAKAELQRDIDRRTTELKRVNEDAEKELQALRDELLRPIAERATRLLQAMAVEQGYTLVIDVSNPDNNVLWANPKNIITAELIKRIDADTPKQSVTPPPAGNRPATTSPAAAPRTTPPAAPATAPPKP